jgi:hypothetical protein
MRAAGNSLLISFLILSSFGCAELSNDRATGSQTELRVQLIHPGISRTEPVERTLVRVQGNDLRPDQYYMDVDSVFCRGTVCRVVKVRLYWDELGFYDRLELTRDGAIGKGQGEPFTGRDYQQLDRVLSNRQTRVWDINLETIGLVQVGEGMVDAVSSATVVLDKSEYVEGAAWTCYTLWHWVNGGVHQVIRNSTASDLTLTELRAMTGSHEAERQAFAVEQLRVQQCYDCETLAAMELLAATASTTLLDPMLRYAEAGPATVYYPLLAELLQAHTQAARIKCLNSIRVAGHPVPETFMQEVAEPILTGKCYPEIDLLLRIASESRNDSPQVRACILNLLDCPDPIIARRAYWFLRNRPLSDSERERLDQFQSQHADIL